MVSFNDVIKVILVFVNNQVINDKFNIEELVVVIDVIEFFLVEVVIV